MVTCYDLQEEEPLSNDELNQVTVSKTQPLKSFRLRLPEEGDWDRMVLQLEGEGQFLEESNIAMEVVEQDVEALRSGNILYLLIQPTKVSELYVVVSG